MADIKNILKGTLGTIYSDLKKILVFEQITTKNLIKGKKVGAKLDDCMEELRKLRLSLLKKNIVPSVAINTKKRMVKLEEVINNIKAEEFHRIEDIKHLVLGLIGLVSNLERVEIQLKEVGADLPEFFKAVKEWKDWLGVTIENLEHIEKEINQENLNEEKITELIETQKEWEELIAINQVILRELKNQIDDLSIEKVQVILGNVLKSYDIYVTSSAKKNLKDPHLFNLFKDFLGKIVQMGQVVNSDRPTKIWRKVGWLIRGELPGAVRIFFTLDGKKLIIYEIVRHDIEYVKVSNALTNGTYSPSKIEPLNEFYSSEAAA